MDCTKKASTDATGVDYSSRKSRVSSYRTKKVGEDRGNFYQEGITNKAERNMNITGLQPIKCARH